MELTRRDTKEMGVSGDQVANQEVRSPELLATVGLEIHI